MAQREQHWDKGQQLLLVLIVGFNIIPHTMTIPPWATALAALCLVWKTLTLTRGVSMPNKYLLWGLVGAGIGGILIDYGTILGQEPASAMLVLLASMKLLETNRYRDAMLVIFTSYFLLMAHLLNSQTILSTIFMGLDVLLVTTLMFQLHKRDRRTSVRSFRPAMRMLAIAIPVWIFLFLAFPRFSAGLWSMRTQNGTSTGFSTELTPGSVSTLTQNDETAFRVSFEGGKLPAADTLYWRGSVLTNSNGLQWSKDQVLSYQADRKVETANQPARADESTVEYDVWLEPLFQKWIFVLDYPVFVNPSERLQRNGLSNRQGFIYETERENISRSFYHAGAIGRAAPTELEDKYKMRYLQLPTTLDQEIHDLTKKFRAQAEAMEDKSEPLEMRLSQQVLDWFAAEKFHYTREPGALKAKTGTAQLTEFLFDRRKGFCEHYAAAYATLMRVMGVPSRITLGFQGGKMNELGRYLIVRNLDAHAWAEIWVAKKSSDQGSVQGPAQGRWTRVDPTEMIAPLRLQMGGDFNRIDSRDLAGMSQSEIRKQLESGLNKWVSQAALAWDAAQMQWNSFLVRYDFDYQRSLLSKIGMDGANRIIFFVWTALGVIIFVVCLHLILRKRARREDATLKEWNRFCTELAKVGINRGPTEGPMQFARRASKLRPKDERTIMKLANAFIQLRYGRVAPTETGLRQKDFRLQVRQFQLRP
jgi:transglutaminase-like putative cysteine protease